MCGIEKEEADWAVVVVVVGGRLVMDTLGAAGCCHAPTTVMNQILRKHFIRIHTDVTLSFMLYMTVTYAILIMHCHIILKFEARGHWHLPTPS